MNVYTYFSPDGPDLDAQLVPIWEESWRRQGWTPRVLTIRDAKKNRFFKPGPPPAVFAWAQVGGGWFTDSHLINFSFNPYRPKIRVGFSLGLLWATKTGAEEHAKCFPGQKTKSFKPIDVGSKLVSCYHCESVEEIQRFIEECLQARKKN